MMRKINIETLFPQSAWMLNLAVKAYGEVKFWLRSLTGNWMAWVVSIT